MTEDEMVGWDHQLNGHEFEQAPGIGDGWKGLVCCSQRGSKELDMTERLNSDNKEYSNSQSQKVHWGLSWWFTG